MKGTTHLILGATGGIGSALARRLAAAGGEVVLAARDRDRLDGLASELGARSRSLDATDLDAVDELVREVAGDGGLDGVANCVGSLLLKPAHLTNGEEWADTIAVNLTTAFAVTRAAGRHMARSGGSVVLMSSGAARTGLPNHEAIAAAKAGIEGLARAAAASYAARGLRVNVVAPGLTRTPMTARITGSEAAAEASRKMHALGRLGKPEDVASAVAWLLDPANDWVTGQVLGVDGGLSSVRPR